MKTIAITGSIGSGKSTVTKLIAKKYFTQSCDEINKRLLYESEAVREAFPECVIEGKIDKVLLAEKVFSSAVERKRLEGIMHPLILKEIREKLKEHESDRYCFVEVPLLFEAHWEIYFDESLLVVTDLDHLYERLLRDRKMSVEEITKRLESQMDVTKKMRLADHLIFNNGTYEELEAKVSQFLYELEAK